MPYKFYRGKHQNFVAIDTKQLKFKIKIKIKGNVKKINNFDYISPSLSDRIRELIFKSLRRCAPLCK